MTQPSGAIQWFVARQALVQAQWACYVARVAAGANHYELCLYDIGYVPPDRVVRCKRRRE